MSSASPSIATLLSFTPLSKPTRHHLTKVYSTLFTAVLAASFSAYISLHLPIPFPYVLLPLLSIGTTFYFLSLPSHNLTSRSRAFHIAAAASGASTSPLIAFATTVDPSAVPAALAASSAVFACLSAAVAFSSRRDFLYLGTALGTAISGLFWVGLVNSFVQNAYLWSAQVYVGLLVFCGYVLYDSQVIIAKTEAGDSDYIGHAFQLFTDLVAIFRRLLIIIIQNRQRSQEEEDRKRRARR